MALQLCDTNCLSEGNNQKDNSVILPPPTYERTEIETQLEQAFYLWGAVTPAEVRICDCRTLVHHIQYNTYVYHMYHISPGPSRQDALH